MAFLSKKAVDAKRVGDSLVAAFHKANPPLVWRFDLTRNHSFSLALQGQESDWQLGLTSPTGEFQSVAHFPARADAEEAFAETEKILAQDKRPWLSVLMKILGILALLILVIALVFGILVGKAAMQLIPKTQSFTPTASMPSNTQPSAPVGVPLPADQMLRPPP